MSELSHATPLPDDVLLRYLDGQASTAEMTAVEECMPGDTARLAALRSASDRFSASVAAVAVPPLPALPQRRPRRAAAAAVAFLVVSAAAAALPAVRSTVGDAVRRITGQTDPAAPMPPAVSVGVTVRVPWTAPVFTIELENRQARGSIRLERGSAGAVSAFSASAGLMVLPDRLLVRNAVADTSDIRLTVPPGLERLVIRIAGRDRDVDLRSDLPAEIGLAR